MKPNIKSRTVYLGDNLPFLRGINSVCVDLVYADPPPSRNPRNRENCYTSAQTRNLSGATS
ncbi:MAG: hypothetical protein MPK62_12645 [Alphaproteobacteria bacterium]|nr:hypothetical protein [Alphaproteobacteria bacterium]